MGDRCSIREWCKMTASCTRDSKAQRSSDGCALRVLITSRIFVCLKKGKYLVRTASWKAAYITEEHVYRISR